MQAPDADSGDAGRDAADAADAAADVTAADTLILDAAVPDAAPDGTVDAPAADAPVDDPACVTTYFVDCITGDDSDVGTAETTAWLTLSRANEAALSPGDCLRLMRGCSFTGPLHVSWSGTAEARILVSAFGTGPLPTIQNASGNVIVSGSYVTIEQVHLRADAPSTDPGCDDQAIGWRVGVSFEMDASQNILQHSQATELTVGVYLKSGSHHNLVQHNILAENNMMSVLDTTNPDNDGGAFAVLIHGDDNEIAYNEISGQDACTYDYGRDGSAVEIYGGQRNSIHHNLAFDSVAFTELGNSTSENNVFAYNVVRSTKSNTTFLVTRGAGSSWGPISNTFAYNNTVYLTGVSSQAVVCHDGCGPEILSLKNNILWAEWKAAYGDAEFDESHNLYWSSDGTPMVDGFTIAGTSMLADPLFVSAATGNFHLSSSSPAVDAGTIESVSAGFATDFESVDVPSGEAVDLGAYEYVP